MTSFAPPDPSDIQFRQIEFGSEDYEATLVFRDEQLRKPLGVEFRPGELDEEHLDYHLAGFDREGRLMACMVLTPAGENRVKMRQVVVHPDLRNRRVGARFLTWMEAFAAEQGIRHIYCHARHEARTLYERAGYTVTGDMFLEVGLRHWKMHKDL